MGGIYYAVHFCLYVFCFLLHVVHFIYLKKKKKICCKWICIDLLSSFSVAYMYLFWLLHLSPHLIFVVFFHEFVKSILLCVQCMKVFLMLVWNLSVNVGVLLISDSVGMFEYVDEWDWMLLFLFHLYFACHFIHESVPPFFLCFTSERFHAPFLLEYVCNFFYGGGSEWNKQPYQDEKPSCYVY